MDELPHLFPRDIASTEKYLYPKPVRGGEFKLPPRDRAPHSAALVGAVQSAQEQVAQSSGDAPEADRPKGIVLEFCSDPGFKLKLHSLDIRRSGIQLRNARTEDGVMYGTVFVPEGKVGIFVSLFEAYLQDDPRSGKPRHRSLVESITEVRLASLKSFWTDAGAFPEISGPTWWEVWLQEATSSRDVSEVFNERAKAVGLSVSPRELKFPERRVLLTYASTEQLLQIENLFDLLAELRIAKILPGEFLELKPSDQVGFVEEARARIEPPTEDAPAVCHLDTGVSRAHPLIELALSEQHLLSIDPNWTAADTDGHGTGMAGLALYGCLTSLLQDNEPVTLQHRLESVKMFSDMRQHDPELYGEVTAQAVSRSEIEAPERAQRVFCLAITADGRDNGLPSSWSASLDQIASAASDQGSQKRLICVSAGNVPPDLRHEYPNRNQVSGVEDPSQSWNALTVGASTHLSSIHQQEYTGWQPVASPGRLSPSSRTSLVWEDKSWPIKPDIVMEGGNSAIDPSTMRADSIDDLSLLTTHSSHDGALLTTTGDTSAATALASRYAAQVWAKYPDLWPESVRGLLVHSARWTDAMRDEFPYASRERRLRCYGYGIPDIQKALSSASNAATLVVQETLQPFDKGPDSRIVTKDMHLHRLPWPIEVLEPLGELEVRVRVTLSYFIEPSPGRRWTKKHRYQSHGLRFDVKRPLETSEVFQKRMSKAAWDDPDEEFDHGSDNRNWELGYQRRCRGSIHSDTWTGTAAQLASCGQIAIVPVMGWWRERPHLDRWNQQARYSLIASIETDSTEVDLYSAIATQMGVPVDIAVQEE